MYEVSTDTLQAASIDIVNHVSNDTTHQVSVDTICMRTEKAGVLILSIDENGVLRDREGRARNSAWQLIYTQAVVIPDTIADITKITLWSDFTLSNKRSIIVLKDQIYRKHGHTIKPDE